MQTPIDRALEEIRFSIPRAIIDLAFGGQPVFNNPTLRPRFSMEHAIRERVIYKRVLEDMNINGGIQDRVPLLGLPYEIYDQWNRVYVIPKSRTQGRSIRQVLNMTFGLAGSYGMTSTGMNQINTNISQNGRSPVTEMANNVISSYSPIPNVSTTNIRLIGENTVLINEIIPVTDTASLLCLMTHDDEMSNIPVPYWGFLAEFIVLATKAHIYNELIIDLDLGALMGGQELGKVKEIVESYADANMSYIEMRNERVPKAALMMDRSRHARHIKQACGGGL